MAESATKLFARLVLIRDKAGAAHFQRVQIAAKLLADKTWVEDEAGGGGDEDRALTRLEQDCFGDICGLMSLVQLLELYNGVPDFKDWKTARFNLRRLWADYRAKQNPEPARRTQKGPRRVASYVTPSTFEELSPAMKRHEYERVYFALGRMTEKAASLEARADRLAAEGRRPKIVA
jgi:hypothetical protein